MAQLHMGFLEVSITSLLYHRQIYPPNLFEPAHKWGTPCWSSKTLSLASFVGGLVDTLAEDFAEVSEPRPARDSKLEAVVADPTTVFVGENSPNRHLSSQLCRFSPRAFRSGVLRGLVSLKYPTSQLLLIYATPFLP